MTLDILICSLNKGIVRLADVLHPLRDDVRYVVSYQYTDERYLDLIPDQLLNRPDVSLYKYKGQGLSANRNLALEKATADLLLFADDDALYSQNSFSTIFSTFEANPDIDIAFFQATTYKGKLLKSYPSEAMDIDTPTTSYSISAIEMVCRRKQVQGRVRFDERFGLGAPFLTCGEEEIWLVDALRAGLKMRYFPKKIVETSIMLKKALIFQDAGVQRSKGAQTYYTFGARAWWLCFRFAWQASRHKECSFLPLWHHLAEGIRFMQRTR